MKGEGIPAIPPWFPATCSHQDAQLHRFYLRFLNQLQVSECEEVMLVLAGRDRAKCAQCAPGQMCLLFEALGTCMLQCQTP